jgi:hypothetical protein
MRYIERLRLSLSLESSGTATRTLSKASIADPESLDFHMSKRQQRLRSQRGEFMRQYQRKAEPGWDPNDRGYDRQLEEKLKRMSPEELDALLNGTDDETESPNDRNA